MKICAKSDKGLVRLTNEDAYLFAKKDENNFIAFVCDGMGGHLGGSFASNKTIEILKEEYDKLDCSNTTRNVGVWIFDVISKANNFVYNESLSNENLKGMGTTVTGVLMYNNVLYYAHIGDSRIYIYNQNFIDQITTDHTYVNTLLLNGIITYKQALKHPKRHVLTNALGIKKNVSVDIGQINLRNDDSLLICSDGLYNHLDKKRLLKILNEDTDIEAKAENLVNKALELGGADNITLIILQKWMKKRL